MIKRPVNGQLAQRLMIVRKAARLSQRQLAQIIRVSEQTIQNYEHGRSGISIERLAELARALRCSPNDLLREPEAPLPKWLKRFSGQIGIFL
jgi:transcriptional regulator with XRE-family HTH domain